jgi:DNA polymerase III delta prime subunit
MNINQIKAKLKFYLSRNYNVLLIGEHGTGKTSIVKEIFEEEKINYAYFSASTMDPWVDFIGIPKERINTDGVPYLDLVRPQSFAEDKIEAIILDEFNRSHKKVRNAVMELIQFKTINGRHFKNLRVVWAAINPHDEEETYSVERLDPAQFDRFHVKLYFENKPDRAYFSDKYGREWTDIAINWFNKSLDHFNNLKKKNAEEALDIYRISPRTLDYALQIAKDGGDIRDALPKIYNVAELSRELKEGSVYSNIKRIFDERNIDDAKSFINKANVIENAINVIMKDEDYKKFFMPLINKEDLVRYVASNDAVLDYVIREDNIKEFQDVLTTIEKSKQLGASKASKISKALNEYRVEMRKAGAISDNEVPYFKSAIVADSAHVVQLLKDITNSKTIDDLSFQSYAREKVYNNIVENYYSNFVDQNSEITILKILMKIMENSHASTVAEKYNHILPLMNTILRKLTTDGGMTVDAIIAAIKNKKIGVEITRTSKIQRYLDSVLHKMHTTLNII